MEYLAMGQVLIDEARRTWAVEQARSGLHGENISGSDIVDAAKQIEAYVKGATEQAQES